MKVGIVAAAEICAIYPFFGKKLETLSEKNRTAYRVVISKTLTIYLVRCKVGEISAAAATQYLIDTFSPDFIANYGFVTELTENHQKGGTIYVVDHFVHYDFDVSSLGRAKLGEYPEDSDPFIGLDCRNISWPEAFRIPVRATCLSGDTYLKKKSDIDALAKIFPDAAIADMETAGIALTCRENDLPCLIIKIAADPSRYCGIVYDEFYYQSESERCLEELYYIILWLTGQKPEILYLDAR